MFICTGVLCFFERAIENKLLRGEVGKKWITLIFVNFFLLSSFCFLQKKSEKTEAVGTELILPLTGLLFTIRFP